MPSVTRLIKGCIAALAVVAGCATTIAVVGNARPPYASTAPELASGAPQSTADRFRSEFAEWPRRTRRQHGHVPFITKEAASSKTAMPFTD